MRDEVAVDTAGQHEDPDRIVGCDRVHELFELAHRGHRHQIAREPGERRERDAVSTVERPVRHGCGTYCLAARDASERRTVRAMRMRKLTAIGMLVAIVVLAACGSSSKSSSSAPKPTVATTGGTGAAGSLAPVSTKLGTGVTPTEIKVGVLMIDYDCLANVQDSARPDQKQAFQIFIDDINNKGGINGRKIVPYFETSCPIQDQSSGAACTKLTDDDKVFAVIGVFYNLAGDAQLCYTKRHNTPIVADSLNQGLVNKVPGGMIVTPDIIPERRLDVIMALLKQQNTLTGKKVGTLSDAASKSRVGTVVAPALRDLGVERGTDATLSITGSDTTEAQAQLDSFIERWKGDGTNALILIGAAASSKQFIEKVKKQIPNMTLIADTTSVLDGAARGVEGARHAEPVRRHRHGRGSDRRGTHQDATLHVLSRHLGEGNRPQGSVAAHQGDAAERQDERDLRFGGGRLPVHEFFQHDRQARGAVPECRQLEAGRQQLRTDRRHVDDLRHHPRRQVRRRRHLRPGGVRPVDRRRRRLETRNADSERQHEGQPNLQSPRTLKSPTVR